MTSTAKWNDYSKPAYISKVEASVFFMFLFYALWSQYFFLTILGSLVFISILRYMWKPYFPPVLLFVIMFHWIQVFCTILYADFLQISMDELFQSESTDFLFVMTFLQIFAMTLVFHLYVNFGNGKMQVSFNTLRAAVERLNIRNVLVGYFVSAALLPIIMSIASKSPSLFQLLMPLSIVKGCFVGLLLFIFFLKKNTNKRIIVAVLLFDFVTSFVSYFSDFKSFFVVLMLTYMTIYPHLRKITGLKVLFIVFGLIIFFSFWSYVKGDYRSYLNQGSSKQAVNVSNIDALSFFGREVSDFKIDNLKEGATIFLSRIQYMERYSEVYARVPKVIEHQNGRELENTLEFIFIPRVLNPNKGIKDASVRTSHYTGKKFSNAAQGTSISMGYFVDLYIDFGLYIMFIPLMLIAMLLAVIYKVMLKLKFNILFTYSLIIATFVTFGYFESDSYYFFGTLRNTIAFMILGHFTFFKRLHKYILVK